ncbi:glycosyl transferase family 1 [Lamprobacter modestohalophilus]|uniref:Glycosyl transferase family 1 n=1 Tax=Lamprobacter modestohalophilus TaxID=1064514 RepID=A0A9X1B398_9GAMM|nr:glycosyltransferase family 4 protein [Lamprobacter modestohalophilus]MBK1617431.1 glycosyl transferase family 1 [Lamprobacter modestohalophilus]
MKKTLLLTENFPPKQGGSSRWFWELYSRLPTNKVLVIANNTKGGREWDAIHSILIERLPLSSTEWGLKSLTGLAFYIRSTWALFKIIKARNIEEVHCGRVIPEGVIARILNLVTTIRYRCYVHGEDVESAATSREQSLLVREVCRKALSLICNSQNTINLVEKLGYSDSDKCYLLHPGVDLERFVPAPTDIDIQERLGWSQKRVLLTVGRLQRRKGQDFLIKAMPSLLKRFPDLFYAIVGQGDCYDELQDLIDSNDLSENVKIYPKMSDEQLVQCYQQCDLVILPNRTIGNDIEGFGMVLVEAQACGKPVIAGRSGGTAETMIVGETGFLIDCTSPDRLVDELLPLLGLQPLIPDQNAPREHVLQHFSWVRHVEKARGHFSQ